MELGFYWFTSPLRLLYTFTSELGVQNLAWPALIIVLIQACRDLVTLQLLPSVSDAHAREVSAEATHQLEKLDSHTFPLGFTTGGELHN